MLIICNCFIYLVVVVNIYQLYNFKGDWNYGI